MIVFGHGDESDANKLNSLLSIDVARAAGADGMECDVRRTADDALVVVHGHALADGGQIAATLARDLPPDIPSLNEWLDRSHGFMVNLELKNFPHDPAYDPTEQIAELTLDLLAERRGRDHVLISCFGLGCLDVVRARAPHIPTAVLLLSRRPAEELLDAVVEHGHTLVHPYDTMVDQSFMAEARRRSVKVNVWVGPVGDQRLQQLIELGVDGIITDAPGRALRACGR